LTHLSLSLQNAVVTILNPGTFFYAFLMLVEPMTSPVKKSKQILYGVTVAALTIGLIHSQKIAGISFFDVSLTALLLGNLLFFKFR
jgi:Na+-translocating ferredoxin:NAD+ oxidoreductase RnfD subunit